MSRQTVTSIGMSQLKKLIQAVTVQLLTHMHHREVKDLVEYGNSWEFPVIFFLFQGFICRTARVKV
jgi:hypothetical protein